MARKINSIKEINDTRETWKLAVRITDLCCVQNSQVAGSIDMVFMEENGDKIHVVVRNYDFDKWKNQLKEGSTYIVQNFQVESNEGQYKISKHPHKLIFRKGTIVKEQDLPQIPKYVYNFTSFEDIISGHASADVLVDVIGEFVNLAQNQIHNKPKKVVFNMKDQRSNTLSCTLWREYATLLWHFLQEHKSGPIVILLTLAKIKDSQGPYPKSIQNSMYRSKLLINENIVEIQQYRNSLDSDNFSDSFSQRITQLSACSQVLSEDNFLKDVQVKSVIEINSLMQETYCVTVGKIDKIFAGNGWSYEGCSKCNKKADPKVVPYICANCGKTISETIPRFRIEVKVSDNKESSKFVLWDRECCQLLKKTAAELKEQLLNVGELDPMAVPQDVDDIWGKTLAFKIKVQPAYKRCSVIQVSDDLQIIETIKRSIGHDEDTLTVEKGKSISSLTREDELYDSQSFSATADYDPDLLGSLTPAKRLTSNVQLDDLASQEQPSGQLSSTKLAKHIKTE